MRIEVRGRAWWLGGVVCLVAAVVNTVFIAAALDPFAVDTLADRGFPFVTLAALLCGTMGSLVLSRRSRHPIGRLLVLCGVVTALSLACDAYAYWVLAGGGHGPAPVVMAVNWLASALNGNITLAGFAVIFLLAPDGTPASPRWRVAIAVAVAGATLMELPPFVEPMTYLTATDPVATTPAARLARLAGALLLVGAFVAALVSLVRRQRRSTGLQRAQIRWFSSAAGFLAVAWGWLILVQYAVPGASYALSIVPLMTAVLWFPVAIAIAVLGHRLYEIELILNRGWLLLGATAFVGVGYVVLVTVVSTSMAGFWASALAAATVACAFQPLRVRLVQLADRLAYGDQARPYLALADLSRRLHHTPDQARLLLSVAEACSQATGAAAARVDLFDAAGTRLDTAIAPAGAVLDEAAAVRLDVRYWGETLGALWVQPAAGRALRRRDLLVLTGFSEQAGVALRNLRLDDELAERVAELGEVVAGLQESRERVLRARNDQLAALERSLARDVAPRLETVAGELDRRADEVPPPDDRSWAVVDTELAAAREQLRSISHGLHPSLLEAEGLGPALRSLLHRRGAAALVLADDLRTRRFDPLVESVVYRGVAQVLESGHALHRVELRVDGPDLVAVLAGAELATAVGADLRDPVEGRGGVVGGVDGVLTLRMPLVFTTSSAALS
jgi:hypothetical protein